MRASYCWLCDFDTVLDKYDVELVTEFEDPGAAEHVKLFTAGERGNERRIDVVPSHPVMIVGKIAAGYEN